MTLAFDLGEGLEEGQNIYYNLCPFELMQPKTVSLPV